MWKDVALPKSTIGSTCARWWKLHFTTKLSSVGTVSSWPEATGAFHHKSVTTQAAAAATPTINMSAKRTCQVRLLLASIFPSPFFLTTLLLFCVPTSVPVHGLHLSHAHRHETDKKMGKALLSSALQPEDPQEGSDSSMASFGSSSLTLSSSASMAGYGPSSIGCPFVPCSDPLAGQDKRKGTRHSRTAVVSSDAELANCHELKTLINLVFADYAYKPLGIHLLETV